MAMTNRPEYSATSIGAAAYSAWTSAQSGTIMGVTSRGFFLRTAPDRVLFLSSESYRGPLTITLLPSLQTGLAQRSLEIGATAQFSANQLNFSSIDLTISRSDAGVWQAPLPTAPLRSHAAIVAALRSIVAALPAQRMDGFGALLIPLLDRTASVPEDQAALFATVASLPALLARHQGPQAVERAIDLLGRGRGLTPSGDDCVLGLLLMLNRWARAKACAERGTLPKQVELWPEFKQQVIDAAYQRTTTISANLIECAAQGETDERLINVVDNILTGRLNVADCVAGVLDWGSSSGIDALVGIAIAVMAL